MFIIIVVLELTFFHTRFTTFHTHASLFTFFLCFFVLFHSCCSHARVFGKHSCMTSTFPIAILNIRNGRRVTCRKTTIIIYTSTMHQVSILLHEMIVSTMLFNLLELWIIIHSPLNIAKTWTFINWRIEILSWLFEPNQVGCLNPTKLSVRCLNPTVCLFYLKNPMRFKNPIEAAVSLSLKKA